MTTPGYPSLGTRSLRMAAMLMLLAVRAAPAEEPIFETPMPKLTRISREGVREPLPMVDIRRREILLCERFLRIDPPDESYVLFAVEGFRGIAIESREVLTRGDEAELQVVFAHPERPVMDVWARGDDVRVLVLDDHYSTMSAWHALVDGQLGPEVDTPEGYPGPVRLELFPAVTGGIELFSGAGLGLGVSGSGTP